MEVILSLCRSHVDGTGSGDRLRHLLAGGIDRQRLAIMAHREGVAPVIDHELSALGDQDMARDWGGLRALSSRARIKSLALAAQAIQAVEAIHAAGIPVLLLKGLIEGHDSWCAPTLRQARDVDLYVPPDRARETASLLLSLGLEPVIPGAEESAGEQWQYPLEVTFINRKTDTCIDLHWSLCSPANLFPLDMKDAWERHVSLAVAGCHLPTLPRAERLLHLCVHGTEHRWDRLCWLMDIAKLMEREDGLPERCWVLARDLRLERTLARSLHVLELVLGVAEPLPVPLQSRDRILAQAWANARWRESNGTKNRIKALVTTLQTCETPRQVVAILMARLMPGERDLRAHPDAGPCKRSAMRLIRLISELLRLRPAP